MSNSLIVQTNRDSSLRQRSLSANERNRLLFIMELNSPGSRSEYRRGLSELISYLRTEFGLNESSCMREHINSYKNHLMLNKSNSKSTINKKLAIASSYFNFLAQRDLRDDNPCELVKRFRMANIGTSSAITRKEIELIYKVIPTDKFKDLQLKTMIVLLFETGIRISELLNLKIDSIRKDFGEIILFFEQKGGVIHKVRLNDTSLAFLGEFLEKKQSILKETIGDSTYLFTTKTGRIFNRKNFSKSLVSISLKAGLQGRIHPHTGRVSFIRQRHLEGVDIYSIRKMVGHSSVRTTERYLN